MHEDDSGYELNDPKHPDYHDRMATSADDRRKREREDELYAEELQAEKSGWNDADA